MRNITIDKSKCTNCLTCVVVCPMGVIRSNNQNGTITMEIYQDAQCSNCGHCYSYCPEGAILIDYPEAKPYAGPFPHDEIIPDQIRYYLSNRRSVRKFKKIPVDRNTLDELVEIARFAPTGVNAQNIQWIIIFNTFKLHKLFKIIFDWAETQMKQDGTNPQLAFLRKAGESWANGIDLICRNAPHLALAIAPDNVLTGPTDAVIATTYMEVAAPAYDVGTCWAGYFQKIAAQCKELRDELRIPEGYSVYGALMIGYPEYKQYRIPKRNAQKVSWV